MPSVMVQDRPMAATADSIHARVAKAIAARIGFACYRIWFGRSQFWVHQSSLFITVPDDLTLERIENRFWRSISEAFVSEFGVTPRISIIVDESVGEVSPKKENIITPVPAKGSAKGRSDSVLPVPKALVTECTFESFVVTEDNKEAYETVKSVVDSSECFANNPLAIFGPENSGKTHLLTALCDAYSQKRPSEPVVYTTGDRLAEGIKRSREQDPGLTQIMRSLASASLLVVDEVDILLKEKGIQCELLHVVNQRIARGVRIVLAGREDPRYAGTPTEGLAERLLCGKVVGTMRPSPRIREMILRQMCEKAGVAINNDAVRWIVQRIVRDPRELVGVVVRLRAANQGKEFDAQAVSAVLHDLNVPLNCSVSPEVIIRVVANFFHLSKDLLTGNSRHKDVSLARGIVAYLMRNMTNLSYPEIGERIGGKNHSTAISAYRRIGQCLQEDSACKVEWTDSVSTHSMLLRELVDGLEAQIREEALSNVPNV